MVQLYVPLTICPSVCPSAFLSVSQADEPVLNALSACKMLEGMSKLEIQTDTKLSMKELVQKLEDRAHGETLN